MMLTLTSDFESDSFLSEPSICGKTLEKASTESIRRNIDLQGEKLNEIASNNKQLIFVESQLAKLRAELEKSEMLRQTLEYELTLLRTQHGKQSAFTNQLQQQFNETNEQVKELQAELKKVNHQKDNQIKEKDKKIKDLENEIESFHDRERRIETLNEQIQKMERTFTDSENLSRQNLAQSIIAKEREADLKREHQVVQIKLEYSEQALEQERQLSSEAKLNVQLLNNRLADMEAKCEKFKEICQNQERKIDELERQCSNEKLLRTTLSKVQSELETNCAEKQKITVDYEKQLKHIREELANYRRKFRNNEDRYNQIVQKVFEYLRLSKIVTDSYSNNQSDVCLPTLKQLEELKIFMEQLRTTKIDQTNEINRLKKVIERLNKSSINLRQIEHQTEINREKIQIEIDQYREKNQILEENLHHLKNENTVLIKENEKKTLLLNVIDVKLSSLVGKNSTSMENNLIELERQWKNLHLKLSSLEEKLIERDNGTLQLTQKLEEQVLNLKTDLDQRHQVFVTQKNQLLVNNQNQIQHLNIQLQKMEIRLNENEKILTTTHEANKKLNDEKEKLMIIMKHLISMIVPYRRRYNQLIDSYRFLKQSLNSFDQIQQIVLASDSFASRKSLRIYVISVLALRRFSCFKTNSTKIVQTANFIYEQFNFHSLNMNFIQNVNTDDVSHSLAIQLNKIYPPFVKGTLVKLIAGGLLSSSPSSSQTRICDRIHALLIRFDQAESKAQVKEIECSDLRRKLKAIENEIDNRIDYNKFERICDELQRALDREKQAQALLNEQNNQLKSLTEIIHQTQQERDFVQDKCNQVLQNEKFSKDKIEQLTKTQQQMDENVKRAEKAIRLVVTDKEQISSYCNRINSALGVSEKRGLEYFEQLISQLDALVQLPTNYDDNKRSPPEMISCQGMAMGFINLLNRLKGLLVSNKNDIETLKEHCQMLTEQFRQLTNEDYSQVESTQTVVVQAHPVRVQVNHHPQSAFKPIKPDQD